MNDLFQKKKLFQIITITYTNKYINKQTNIKKKWIGIQNQQYQIIPKLRLVKLFTLTHKKTFLQLVGIIENEKKEEIKKKIEKEKKLKEAIKKAKEKGIQTAQIANSIPPIEQLNYKNMNLLYNRTQNINQNNLIH